MGSMFLSYGLVRQLHFLLILFYIGQCYAGVLPLSFKQNDILSMADEQSEVTPASTPKISKKSTAKKAEELNSLKVPLLNSSVSLPNLNGTKNSSFDLKSSTSTIPPIETLNFTGNGSKKSDTGNTLLVNSGQDKDMHKLELDGNNATLAPISNGTSQVKLSNSTSNLSSKNVTTFGIEDVEVSNKTGGLGNETRVEEFNTDLNGNDSNASTSPLRNDSESSHVNFSGDSSDGIEKINGSLDLDTGIESGVSGEMANRSDATESGGIFSNLGLDFITNSEVAKNAAMAMQVFNFSDTLTDHIIEENEFHTFLDVELPTPDVDNLNNSINTDAEKLEQFNSSDKNMNAENVEALDSTENETNTSNLTEIVETEKETSDYNTTALENGALESATMNETLNLDISVTANDTDFGEFENETLDTEFETVAGTLEEVDLIERLEDVIETLISNVSTTANETDLIQFENEILDTEFENINGTLELTTLTELIEDMDEILNSNVSTIADEADIVELEIVTELPEATDFVQPMKTENELSMSNVSNINGTGISEVPLAEVDSNSTDVSPQCPPPGICIFWFLSQDTCSVNSHCLGSRICCKIGCSKTCIEI